MTGGPTARNAAGATVGGSTVVGIDVGGTSIKASLLRGGDRLGHWREATPQGDPTGLALRDAVLRLVEQARTVAPVDAVGLVVPGVVDEERGVCVQAINLGWIDLDIASLFRDVIDVPLAFGQDVRAGALAEAVSGAARDADGSVVFIPVGTGLASALVLDGVPLAAGGWAGEIGQFVLPSGPFAGLRVEEIASASAVARRSGLPDARTAAERVAAGDAEVVAIWTDAVEVLADAIAWTAAVVAPSVVVIGGGLALAGPLLLDPLRSAVEARLGILRSPSIVQAAHGDEAGVIGAGLLAERALLGRRS
ncbi:ROK family protein [Plantibacter sp. YIM 135347]|uniref:ROK family protein n=1 Tax=Plantibacter sp. YIM 135347 TaxID=3423919 RepID=UPI003D3497A7